MSPLRTYLNNYIQTMQSLQSQYANSQYLLKAAETKWGDDDPRYVILLEMRLTEAHAAATKWDTPPNEPTQDADNPDEQPNELIDWLPICIKALQNVLADAIDDAALLEKANKEWGPDSNGYLLVTEYNGFTESTD